MELTWPLKIRIAAAAAVGVVIIGILGWPYVKPFDPMGPVLLDNLTASGIMILLGSAVLVGFIANFVSWPFGPEIGILAVPAGLSVWACRTASVGAWVQQKATLPSQESQHIIATIAKRQEIFNTMKWEPLFWLLVVLAGFGGVMLGQFIKPSRIAPSDSNQTEKSKNDFFNSLLRLIGCTDYLAIIAPKTELSPEQEQKQKKEQKSAFYLNAAIGLVASVLIGHFCIRIIAQDVGIQDSKYQTVMTQPFLGQIIFAVFASFFVAAFVVKRFLDVGYICPIIATGLVTGFTIILFVKPEVVEYFVKNLPVVAFPNSVVSILPVQMLAFGTLGAITGYWGAIRYGYWRKHEIK
jgi:hypothetical protein